MNLGSDQFMVALCICRGAKPTTTIPTNYTDNVVTRISPKVSVLGSWGIRMLVGHDASCQCLKYGTLILRLGT
jgi:hypothetical protein